MPPPERRRPDPEPLDTDPRPAVRLGIGVWVVLLGLALVFHDRLTEDGNGWWVWTAVSGALLGLLGLVILRNWPGDGAGDDRS
ncbi:MAG: DUF2530 domain-containing protein [Actinomycetales bacterium]|nr:DUF2530 domain-containing protein [Actinomycetales bacterium]